LQVEACRLLYLLAPHFAELAKASHTSKQAEFVEDLDWQLALR
jgi:hypothetical protein